MQLAVCLFQKSQTNIESAAEEKDPGVLTDDYKRLEVHEQCVQWAEKHKQFLFGTDSNSKSSQIFAIFSQIVRQYHDSVFIQSG